MVSKLETRKDTVQVAIERAFEHVGQIASIITTAGREVTRELGEWATEVFEMREAARRAWSDRDAMAEERPSSVVAERPSPAVEERPSSVVAERPSSAVEERPSSVVAERPRSSAVEEAPPSVLEERPHPILEERTSALQGPSSQAENP